MAKKRIRLGLIGCGGNMRNAHVPRLQADGAVDIVAVADPAEEQAELLIEKWGREAKRYGDYRQMIRQEELDAVFISSPHSTHYDQARLALSNGLHVLVEKPLTISSRHSKALIGLAQKKERFIQVSYQRNYMRPHVYARELIAKGALGKLCGIAAYVTQGWGGAGGWRQVPELSGGGMFMDTGSHLVASALWITGLEPVEVTAYMDNVGRKVDINGVVNVRFKGGALGNLTTLGGAGRHDERIAIHGSEGSLVFHLHQWQVRQVLVNDEPMQIPGRIKEDTPDGAFLRWIRYGGRGYESPDFALQVARLSEAAYASVQQKRPARVAR